MLPSASPAPRPRGSRDAYGFLHLSGPPRRLERRRQERWSKVLKRSPSRAPRQNSVLPRGLFNQAPARYRPADFFCCSFCPTSGDSAGSTSPTASPSWLFQHTGDPRGGRQGRSSSPRSNAAFHRVSGRSTLTAAPLPRAQQLMARTATVSSDRGDQVEQLFQWPERR